MNAKLRVFINRVVLPAAALLALGARVTSAQTAYDKIMDNNFWNDGRNVTGLRSGKLVKVSYAELQGNVVSGDFKPSYESSSFFNAGALAKTRVDLKEFSMTGSFSFSQKQGKDMCGSMFIKPGFYPVDVLEYTPGDKTLQTYSFSGGIAVPIGEHWTIGSGIDFESANYAKRKDIRHTNYRLDMTITPSVTFRMDRWTAGASMIFSKNSESIQAEQIGTATADSYLAFLDKGLMYGVQQVWNGSGVHLAESGLDRFAAKEHSLGIAAQLERVLPHGALYADLELLASNGEIGEKSYSFFRFPGRKATARMGYRSESANGSNIFRIRCEWYRQWNNEYVTDKISSGGVTVPVTYGLNRIYERRRAEVAPEYSFYGAGNLSWLYKVCVKAGYIRLTEQSSAVYPYSFYGDNDIVSASAAASFRLGGFRLGGSLGFLKGFREESGEIAAGESDSGSAPFRPESWYNIWDEWENAARIGAGLSLRYDFSIGRVHGLFAEVAGNLLHGFDIACLTGANRVEGTIRIGYEF